MTSKLPTETTPGQWCFKIVADLDDREPQLRVRFLGDASLLPVNSTAERWWNVQVLSTSLRYGGIIGVLFGEDGGIVDLGTIDREPVQELSQNPRFAHLTDVQFEGMGLPKHLWKEHPQYEEMLRQLTQAAAAQTFVWYVLQGSTIVDVKELTPEVDDFLCRWVREQGQRAETARLEKRCSL
jgi:hypothetical protein